MAVTVTWQDEYSVGVAEIDQQHQKLFAIYNKLVANSEGGEQRRAKVGKVLEELGSYIDYHFKAEEGYYQAEPKLLASHRQKHFDFVKKIISLTGNFHDARAVTYDLLFFLSSWLVAHVLKDDQAAFARLRQQGFIE